ncbi:MAG: DUF898 family protein [Hansschlegelia sp.]
MDAVAMGANVSGAPGVRPRFHGSARTMAPVVLKGSLLTFLTLGLYRFWYVTSVRRFLWDATEIDGDALEYTGRGRELFIGFLIALAVVIPLYVLIAIVGLVMGPIAQVALQPVSTIVLLVLAQYALFRARRYRLTRTLWRGVRMGQSGSGFAYAGRSLGWGLVTLLTLGLTYPFMRASLERYKMNNTWFGDQQGVFSGGGWGLMKRGILLWLVCWIAIAAPLGVAAEIARRQQFKVWDESASFGVIGLLVGASIIAFVVVLAALALYQTIEFRWWARSSRIGRATFECDIGLAAFLKVYLLFGLATLAAILLIGAIFGGLGVALAGGLAEGRLTAWPAITGAVGYFTVAITIAALWQIFGARLIWRRSFESLTVINLGAVVAGQSSEPPANAFGEGVADALDFGGF